MILTKEWQEYDHSEGYEKKQQDVMLKNGDIILNCWPNAGVWMPLQKEGNEQYYGKQISTGKTWKVRLTHSKH